MVQNYSVIAIRPVLGPTVGGKVLPNVQILTFSDEHFRLNVKETELTYMHTVTQLGEASRGAGVRPSP